MQKVATARRPDALKNTVNAIKLDWSAENTANARNARMECKEKEIIATNKKDLSLQ